MRCDQCKHWKPEPDEFEWEAKEAGFRQCAAVRERWVIQDEAADLRKEHRSEEAYLEARKAALKAALAYVQDGSEYRAELFTTPDFFCALFEELPADMVVAA